MKHWVNYRYRLFYHLCTYSEDAEKAKSSIRKVGDRKIQIKFANKKPLKKNQKHRGFDKQEDEATGDVEAPREKKGNLFQAFSSKF